MAKKKTNRSNKRNVKTAPPLLSRFANYRPYFLVRAVLYAYSELNDLTEFAEKMATKNTPHPTGVPTPGSDRWQFSDEWRAELMRRVKLFWVREVNQYLKHGAEPQDTGQFPYDVGLVVMLWKRYVKYSSGTNDPDNPTPNLDDFIKEVDTEGVEFSTKTDRWFGHRAVALTIAALYADNVRTGREQVSDRGVSTTLDRQQQFERARELWVALLKDKKAAAWFPLSVTGVATAYNMFKKARPRETWLQCEEAKNIVKAVTWLSHDATPFDFPEPKPKPKPKP